MISVLLLIAAVAAAPGSVLCGVARTDEGLPIPGVSVVADGGVSATTDSTGTYLLAPIVAGSHALRFTRLGYRPLTLSVLVVDGASTRVDVTLLPLPIALDEVQVLSRRSPDAGRMPEPSDAPLDPGAWRAPGREIRESPRLDHADVLRVLAQSPAVQMQPESPTTLHVRGGSADQNLILLDGIPLENGVHASDVLSAVNPNAVSDITLGGGATSARYGGRLSGVVNIQTVEPGTDVVQTHGTLSPLLASGLLTIPLGRIGGGVLVSVRHSYGDMFPALSSAGTNEGPNGPTWRDVLAKGTARIGGGRLSALVFATHDSYLFDAQIGRAAGLDTTVSGIVAPVGADAASSLDAPQNRFDWTATAQGLRWRRAVGGGAFTANLWRSETVVGAEWAARRGPIHLSSSLVRAGGTAEITWPRSDGRMTTGIQVDRIRTDYAASNSTGARSLNLAAHPAIVAAFLERQWTMGSRWETTAGVHLPSISGDVPQIEPRLTVTAKLPRGIAASVGYARNHQYLQSLRNEESLVDAIIGVNLPVAAGAGDVPVARADALSASLTVPLPANVRLTLEGYRRWLDGLVLVAPGTSQPFALKGFDTGAGRASGLGASLAYGGERLNWDASLALTSVSRTGRAIRYQPTFAPLSSGSLGATYRVSPVTRLRLAAWVASQRRTTAVDDMVRCKWSRALERRRDLSGTPQQYAASLGTSRLPSYARLDLSVRHDVSLSADAVLTGFAGVHNVFNARNAFGYSLGDQGEQQTLPMMPRSLTFGLEWHR